ncbi:uncharacterized protein LOC8264810 isoform X4 [Ricinus communis]|uniref:uncharacterized protein LOC8264810 isoform X4 n=1 Tax=Ricinus communis TaxID=3988 RepID=UPI00201AAAD7|nr:uncharacterized protein LOC8264810 isoform X4 [Ricinus communis]
MQLPRISIAKPRWSLRYLLTTSRHFSSISKSKVNNHYLDKEREDFLPWLETKAGIEVSSKLYIGKSQFGRSLFASKSIQTGDCILRVPYSAVMKLGVLQSLPSSFWLIRKLARNPSGPLISAAFLNLAKCIARYSGAKVLEHFPQISRSITFQDFMHAYALVKSRAWGSTKGVSLIPFADFLNHDGFSEAVVLNDEDKQVSEVAADRNYAPHEEVLIRYGKFSNATLLLDFGFSLPYNIHEQVEIQINIPDHDTLREMKFEILRLHHIPATKDDNGFNSSWDSFLIKEVRSAGGKGKGLPQSLRAFARVLCCTSHQDLNDLVLEAAQTDGRLARRALENSSREIQAHEILLSRINQVIEEYSASIKLLESSTSLSICKRFALRRQMALDLLTGELRVLKSASAWLKNYCTSLLQQTPQTTISSANSDHVSVQE